MWGEHMDINRNGCFWRLERSWKYGWSYRIERVRLSKSYCDDDFVSAPSAHSISQLQSELFRSWEQTASLILHSVPMELQVPKTGYSLAGATVDAKERGRLKWLGIWLRLVVMSRKNKETVTCNTEHLFLYLLFLYFFVFLPTWTKIFQLKNSSALSSSCC